MIGEKRPDVREELLGESRTLIKGDVRLTIETEAATFSDNVGRLFSEEIRIPAPRFTPRSDSVRRRLKSSMED